VKSRALAFGLGLAVGVAATLLYGLTLEARDVSIYVARNEREPWQSWPS
jgi:hypothetical protein